MGISTLEIFQVFEIAGASGEAFSYFYSIRFMIPIIIP